MGRIRILVAAIPRMLMDILQQAISQQPDLETVAALIGQEDPRVALARLRPDVVLVGESYEADELGVRALARAQPGAHIVTLSASGRRAAIHAPGEEPLILEDASPDMLLRVLRCLVRGSLAG
jgi:DNA-binding NarL/FixJ family response regulator